MRLLEILIVALSVVILTEHGNAYRILGVFPHLSRSHFIVGEALLKGLAAKGHEVTMISPFMQSEPIANYRDIYLERTVEHAMKGVAVGNFVNFNKLNLAEFADFVHTVSINITKSAMESINFQRFMQKKERFDVVIFEIYVCDALIGLGHYVGAPVIGLSTLGASKWTSDLTGLSDFSSHVPNFYNGFTDRMNFWQRMYNSLSFWYEDFLVETKYYPTQQKFFDDMFRNETKMPTYSELRRNVSVVFVNSHVSYGIPQPAAPNLIEVGGIHIEETIEPLTEDVQTFLDDARVGAIYFSLGSNIKLEKLAPEQFRIIVNAFSEFPDHRILIKGSKDVAIPSHDPSNVLVREWFNQEAILSHPNLKAFITHGGLLSTTEAVHFGKPVVGISVFFDQSLNMKLAQQKGYGINVPFEELTEYKLKSAIRQILANASYTETAKLISQRYHDQLSTPLERAIYWVEHVAKNRGSLYMQSSGVHLPFRVYYNLDVYAFIIAVFCVVNYILYKIFRFLLHAIDGRRRGKQKSH